MEPLRAEQIYGNWATLLLPIEEDESINFAKLEAQIDYLIAAEVNGIYCNGSAGEFYNQTEDEFYKIASLLAEKCNQAKMNFQIGCSDLNPKQSLERVRRVVDLKPGAIQVILPDWYAPSMIEVIDYLKVMVETAYPIGLVLYNPPHAKKKLIPKDFYEIKQAGVNLVGCKVSGGDENWYKEMKALNPELSVFIPGHRLATGIKNGAHGSYSNVACLNPKVAQLWYEQMKTDLPAALALEEKILDFIINHIVPYITERGYSDMAIDKFMAAIGGWNNAGTRLRWPYRPVNENEVKKMQRIAKQIVPTFF